MLISPAKDKLYYTMQLYFQHGEKVSNNIAEYEGLVARLKAATALGSGASESTTTPWVILVINVNISLVVLILLSSIFQISPTVEWHRKMMWNPFKMLRTKDWLKLKAQDSAFSILSDPRSH